MKMKYTIKTEKDSNNLVTLPLKAFQEEVSKCLPLLKLHFGVRTHQILVQISPHIPSEEIYISENVIKNLKIPTFVNFELLIDEENLVIGPYFGFLYVKNKSNMDTKLKKLTRYVNHYDEVGGAILAFSQKGVDHSKQTINGYVYNPNSKKWIKGNYSYPSSFMLKMGRLPSRLGNHFKSVHGLSFFNDFYMGKKEMHSLLSRKLPLKNYLPKTISYTHPNDVLFFLKEHRDVYLKPNHSSKGKGIIRVVLRDNEYLIQYHHNNKNIEIKCKNKDNLISILNDKLKKKSYIIQETIPFIMIKDQKVDYRIIMVKNHLGEWEIIAYIARYGKSGSITSNFSTGGHIDYAETSFKSMFHLNESQKDELVNRLTNLALTVGKSIDNTHLHCANMAIDVAIDHKLRLWILEIQHFHPGMKGVEKLNSKLYKKILFNHLQYLKHLSGF